MVSRNCFEFSANGSLGRFALSRSSFVGSEDEGLVGELFRMVVCLARVLRDVGFVCRFILGEGGVLASTVDFVHGYDVVCRGSFVFGVDRRSVVV